MMPSTVKSSPPLALGGRDQAIDLIKGVACLLMVVAHVPFPHALWLKEATLGSVLFFACTGMNLTGVLERKPGHEWRLAANAVFLIFGGFASNYVLGTLGQADVFQSAGMAILAMLGLRWLLPRHWTWLFPLPFVVHWLNQNIFYWRTTGHGWGAFFLTPGLFPLLPWLSFYMLGAHLRTYPSLRMRVGLALGCGVALGGAAWGWGFVWNKFWMSPDYWLAGCIFAALALSAARQWSGGMPGRVRREVQFWGANSLVFYLLHAFVLRTIQFWVPEGTWLLAGTVAGTAVMLRWGLRVQDWAARAPSWPVLAGCTGFAFFIVGLETYALHGFAVRTVATFGVTLAFLAGQPAWKAWTARFVPMRPRRKSLEPGSVEGAEIAGSVA